MNSSEISNVRYYRISIAVACLIPGLIALLCYARTVGYGFVWDDPQIFSDVAVLKDWNAILAWATAPFFNFGMYFRPLALFSMALEYRAANGEATILHAVNVAFHILNSIMVAALAIAVATTKKYSRNAALVAGITAGSMYAIHISMIQGVSWIAGRFDLLTAFFGLAALLTDRIVINPLCRALLGAFFFFCAALSKEMILGLAILLPLWHLMVADKTASLRSTVLSWQNRPTYIAYIGAGLLYLILRNHFLPSGIGVSTSPLLVQFMMIAKTIGRYLLLVLWPFHLTSPVHHLIKPPDALDAEGALGLMVIALTIGGVILLNGANRAYVLLSACFLLALSPVSQALPVFIRDSFVAERFLQFPAVFAMLALGLLLSHLIVLSSRMLTKVTAITVLVTWFGLSSLYQTKLVPIWKDDKALWTHAYTRSPSSESVTTSLLSIFIAEGKIDEGLAFAEKCRVLQGGHFHPNQQMAFAALLMLRGDYAEALKYIEAVENAIHPQDRNSQFQLHQNWGVIALNARQFSVAVEKFRKAKTWSPYNPESRYLEGIALLAQGHSQEGRYALNEAYALAPAEKAIIMRADELKIVMKLTGKPEPKLDVLNGDSE